MTLDFLPNLRSDKRYMVMVGIRKRLRVYKHINKKRKHTKWHAPVFFIFCLKCGFKILPFPVPVKGSNHLNTCWALEIDYVANKL